MEIQTEEEKWNQRAGISQKDMYVAKNNASHVKLAELVEDLKSDANIFQCIDIF